jgi:glutamate racemase
MIGIFDSGVGGLSALLELKKIDKELACLYFADSAHVPYGEKSPEFIIDRSLKIADFLISQGARVLLMACNTATAVAADELRAKIKIPVVAVEPPIKPAVALTRSGVIGVLATKVTLESDRYQKLLKNYAQSVRIVQRVSNDLVYVVENLPLSNLEDTKHLRMIVEEFLREKVDTIVLGSTHFYFLKDLIKEFSNGLIQTLSPSEASARHLYNLLNQSEILIPKDEDKFFVSGRPELFSQQLSNLLGLNAKAVRIEV